MNMLPLRATSHSQPCPAQLGPCRSVRGSCHLCSEWLPCQSQPTGHRHRPPPDTGQITFRGQSIAGLQPNQIAQTGLLRTFQIPKLFANMSLLENLMIPYYAHSNPFSGRDVNAATRKADDLLELSGLSHLRDAAAKVLSGGQQALLQIARGFMVDNIALYLLDEPFAGVNPIIKEAINRLILKENEETNITFLLVSHEME